MENSNSEDICCREPIADGRIGNAASTSTTYKLFDRQATVHQMMGGGKAADVILWRRRRAPFGIAVVATSGWILIERSGISFLSLCSDVLLILVVILFLRANYAVFRKKQLPTLPELVLSEEMVNNAATTFRVKVNYMLLMAHDITLGKNFRLFFMVMIALWLLSVIGNLISFITLIYIGTIDRYAGLIHRKFSKHYKIMDESLHSRLPGTLFKNKDP